MPSENAIIIDIIPEDPDRDIDEVMNEVKNKLPPNCEIKDTKVEPYVYGLKKIKVMVIVPEEEGLADKIESAISSIEGVDAEIVNITRI
ncbi:MAG: elongation factor 1-beta [Candidatus Njordarchaeia archaeon]